jgi:23S rRNA (guanosine2251-2'-O)-methyltransferase
MARNHAKPRNQSEAGRRKGKKSQRPASDGPNWLWGTHAVAAAIANPKRKILQLLATENAVRRGPFDNAQLVTSKELGHRLPEGAVHQGVAAQIEPLPVLSLEQVIDAAPARICVLDQLSDPHNFGAIYRSAAAFGFGALVLQTRHSPPITGIVAKSAAGAIEAVSEARVVNIARALEQLADAGYHTVGLAGEGTADLAKAVSGTPKVAIVLGAEGSGLRPAVAKACAELASIAISPQMESLNVSNAAAVAFYEASRGLFAER